MNPIDLHCQMCEYSTSHPNPKDLGEAHGNTARFRQNVFHLWRCPKCLTIYNIDPADLPDLYRGYPRFSETLDSFAKATLGNLIKRLEAAGLKKTDSVLYVNFTNNQVFLDLMRHKGYLDVQGYNPYLEPFSHKPTQLFDYVVVNDSLEHVERVYSSLAEYLLWMKSTGVFYISTPDALVVASMDHLDTYSAALHQPFHRVLITETMLHSLAGKLGMRIIASYKRSYLDTLVPFANRRFFEELSRALGDTLDDMYKFPLVVRALVRHPRVLFYGLFGYFFPSAYEPGIVLRRINTGGLHASISKPEPLRLLRQTLGALSSLFATRAAMDRSNADSIRRVKEGKGELTVVLHGIFARYYGAMAPFIRFLKRQGINAVSIGYDWRTHPNPKTQAEGISRQIDVLMREAGVSKINMVGISMGGSVAHYYTELLGGKENVRKLVTVFTPFTPDTKTGKNVASRLVLLINKDAEQDFESARQIKKLFSVQYNLAIYGLNDHIAGNQYPMDAPIEQVGLPGGHTFVSFNPQVMKLTAEYLLKDLQ